MPLNTTTLTGKPSWPILCLAGPEKTGKTWDAAVASSSKHIGRTLWVSAGEDIPHELGELPGVRVEPVPHNGTYKGILRALTDACEEPAKDPDKPNLVVLDSGTKLWNLLSNMAQAEANKRKKQAPEDEAQITMDLWNLAAQRWNHCMDALRAHHGPAIVIARMDIVTVLDEDGRPAKDRRGRVMVTEKIQAHKSLPYDVGAIVKKPELGESVLSSARSVRLAGKLPITYEGFSFTVEQLWQDLGVVGKNKTTDREHAPADNDAARIALLAQIAIEGDRLGRTRQDIAETWGTMYRSHISTTDDLENLEKFLDGLKALKPKTSAPGGDDGTPGAGGEQS